MASLTLDLSTLAAYPTGTSSTWLSPPTPEILELERALISDVAPCLAVPPAGELGLCPILRPDLAEAVLTLVNLHRTAMGLGALVRDPRLQACAEWKALNMGAYLYMDHDDPVPARSWFTRMSLYYPTGRAACAENIAYGFTDATSVMLAWLSDIGHRQNIENSSMVAMGWTVAQTAPTSRQPGLMFWIQDFGSDPVSPTPPPPPPPPGGSMLSQWSSNDLPLILSDAHVRNWARPTATGGLSAGGKDLAAIQKLIADPTAAVTVTTPLGKGLLGTVKLLAAAK